MTPNPGSQPGFIPIQPQRWNLYAGFAQAMASDDAKSELRLWTGLAVAALGVAGIFALLVAVSRVPGADTAFPWPVDFFEKGLVVHVVLSFVVWFFAALGALCVLASYRTGASHPRALGPLWMAPMAAMAASVMMLVPAFGSGDVSLNNYVPVIVDPLFFSGLALLFVATALAVGRLYANLIRRRGPLEPVSISAASLGLIFFVAAATIILAWLRLEADPGVSIGPAYFEDLFWGGGHALQFLNTGLMLAAWYVLGGLALEEPLVRPSLMNAAIQLLAATAVAAPFLYVFLEPFTAEHVEALTNIQYFLAMPVALVAGGAAFTAWNRLTHADSLPWRNFAFQCLLLSMAVFVLGAFLGLFVDGADARTPAHYHAVIGGINLALMGVFHAFVLPLQDRAPGATRGARASVWCYAVGQVLHALGLFWAGGYGAPRKATAGADAGLADVGLYLMGVGAIVAVIGGAIFVIIVAKALLKRA